MDELKEKPIGLIEKTFKYYCDELTPIGFVSLVLLYLFGRKWPFIPHVIVIGTLILIVTLFLNIYRHAMRMGWFFSFRKCLKLFLGRGWVILLLGYDRIKNSWLGKTAVLFSLSNLLLIPHWAWYNFPLMQIAKNGFALLFDFIEAFGDPPAILNALDDWLKTVPMLKTFLSLLQEYIAFTISSNERGYFWGIVGILGISLSFFLFALLCFVLFTFIFRKKYLCCLKSQNDTPIKTKKKEFTK